jgi:ribonuclease BN (tRNA processing enzyme)
MDSLMRLTVLGSSGSAPARDNPASGYLIEHAGTLVLLDAGPGTFAELADRIDPADLDAVVISHIHVDHGSDVMALFAYMAHGAGRGRGPLLIYVPEGAAEYYAAVARATADDPFWRALEFRTVGEGGTAQVGPLHLVFGAASHSVPTICTRIEVAGGSLVYSGDTGPGGGLPGLAQGAGVLMCEATYQEASKDVTYPFHLTAREAGIVASDAGVAMLILTHLPPSLDPGESLAEAAGVFGGEILVARPGLEVDIPGDPIAHLKSV